MPITPPTGLVTALGTAYGSSASGGGSLGGTVMAVTFVSTFGTPVDIGANLSILGTNLGQVGDTLTFAFTGGATATAMLTALGQLVTVPVPFGAQTGNFTVTNARTNDVATAPSPLTLVAPVSRCVSRANVANTVPPATPTVWADCSQQVPTFLGNWKLSRTNGLFFMTGQEPASVSADGYRWVGIGAAMNDIAYNGTRYVGIITNTSNTRLLSSSGSMPADWTSKAITLSLPGQLTAISAANGRFFIGTNNGSYVTSSDGLTWTETDRGLCSGSYQSVQYAGNQPVTFSGGKYHFNAKISANTPVLTCTSSDGLAWSADAVATPDTTAFDGTKYVESRVDGIYTSADGVTFVKSPVTAPIFTKLMWLGTQYVGIETTNNSSTQVHTSTDGINWTLQVLPSPVGLAMIGGQFIYSPELNRALLVGVVGVNGGLTTNGMYVWHTLPAATPAGSLSAPTGLAATGGNNQITATWAAVTGAVGYDVYVSASPSQPISSMTKLATAQAGTTATVQGLTGSATRYFKVVTVIDAVRRGGTSLEANATSTNAMTWVTATTTFPSTHFVGVSWLGNKFVASVGLNQSPQSSVDGLVWTSVAVGANPLMTGRIGYAPSGTTIGPLAVALNNAGGISTSTDGVSWNSRTSGTIKYLSASASNGSIFVVVGDAGTILTSTDAVTWTPRTSGVTTYISDVLWTGSKFMAATTTALLSSNDGLTWTSATIAFTPQSMVWSGSQFVAVAAKVIYTSPDGVSWTTRTSPVTQSLAQVIWNGGMFAIAGAGGTLLTSADGITWVSNALGTAQDMNGVAWSGSQFVVAGRNGTIRVSH